MQSTFRQRQNYAGKKDGRPETYANPPAHVLITPPSRLAGKRTVELPHAGRKPSDISCGRLSGVHEEVRQVRTKPTYQS